MPFDPQQLKYLGPLLSAVIVLFAVFIWGVIKILEIRSKNGNGNAQAKAERREPANESLEYWKVFFESQQLQTQKALTITLQTLVLPVLDRQLQLAEENSRINAKLATLMQEWSPVIHRLEMLLESQKTNGQVKAAGHGGS